MLSILRSEYMYNVYSECFCTSFSLLGCIYLENNKVETMFVEDENITQSQHFVVSHYWTTDKSVTTLYTLVIGLKIYNVSKLKKMKWHFP